MRRPLDHCSTTCGLEDSPPTIRFGQDDRPFDDIIFKTAAGKFKCVTPDLLAKAASASPGTNCSSGARMSLAPERVLRQRSKRDASKLIDTNWGSLPSACKAKLCIWLKARLGIPVWETTTPFGVPVDPDV